MVNTNFGDLAFSWLLLPFTQVKSTDRRMVLGVGKIQSYTFTMNILKCLLNSWVGRSDKQYAV